MVNLNTSVTVSFWRTWQLSLAIAATLLAAGQFSPAAAEPPVYPVDLTDIAASANGGRVVSVSSTIDNDPNFDAKNLISGKVFDPVHQSGIFGWASNKFDPVNMDYITLGFSNNGLRYIGKIVLNPTSDVAPERWAKDIEVQVSTETAEGPFTTVAELTLLRSPQRQEFTILPARARFVRLKFRSNWGSDRAVALGQVEIYEAISTADPMGQVIERLEGAVLDLQHYRNTQIQLGNTGNLAQAAGQSATTRAVSDQLPADLPALTDATFQLVQLLSGEEASRLPVSSTNIAAAKNGGRIVDVSSVFNHDPNYGADKLIDGDNYRQSDDKGSYGWASEGFAPGQQYVTIGFKDDRTHLLGKIVLNPVSNQPTLRWARRVDVQVTTGSAKEGPYHTASTLNLRSEGINQEFVIHPVEAKYVRFMFQANGPGDFTLPNADPDVNSNRSVSLGEIEIYEATASGDVLDALIGRFKQVLSDLKTLRDADVQAHAAQPAPADMPHLTPTVPTPFLASNMG